MWNFIDASSCYLVAMSTENKKDDETQTVKPKKRSEAYKEKEKEELETLEMESTGGGKEGGGGWRNYSMLFIVRKKLVLGHVHNVYY